jgi:hypothetical protein
MPQAIGTLRFGPRGTTVPRKGRWLILECDHDWFDLYAPQVHRELPGRWASVVDSDRATAHEKVEARLGLVKPGFQIPSWGPHISTVRGFDKPSAHRDLWDLGVDLGDVRQEMVSMVESRKFHAAKVASLTAELIKSAAAKPKYRKPVEDALQRSQEAVEERTTRMVRLTRKETRLVAVLKGMTEAQGLPDYVLPGAKVQFGFDPDIKLIREYWFLDVKCRTLGSIRHFFGLDPRPRVPFHLTVAVTSG